MILTLHDQTTIQVSSYNMNYGAARDGEDATPRLQGTLEISEALSMRQMIQRITAANLQDATLTVEEGVDMPLEATGVESLFLTITAGKIQRTAILTME